MASKSRSTPQAARPKKKVSFKARQNLPLPPIESTGKGGLRFWFVGRATPERWKAHSRAFHRYMRDSGALRFCTLAKGGQKWDVHQWLRETGIPLPLSLEEAAAACEHYHLSPAKEVLDAGYTIDAALTFLRKGLVQQRQVQSILEAPVPPRGVKPVLEEVDCNLLKALAKYPHRVKVVDIIPDEANRNRVSVRLHFLCDLGFVDWTPANRRGAAITEMGREFLASIKQWAGSFSPA